ncbi:hypothetical protein D9M68_787820 [compost metagenome]
MRCCVIVSPAEIGLRDWLMRSLSCWRSRRSPRPSAMRPPMIGLPPIGLTRSKVTSSPATLVKSMQRTMGMSVLDCTRSLPSASLWVGIWPVRRFRLVRRCMVAANRPTDCALSASGEP